MSSVTIPTELLPILWDAGADKYAGRFRDANGIPLTGFAVRDTKKTRKVSLVSNGNYLRHYRFPAHLKAPQHPMVRWFNVPMCGMPMMGTDGHWISNDVAIAAAVFDGKKPVGDVLFLNEHSDKRVELVTKAQAAGFEVIEYTRPHNATKLSFVMIGVNQPLGELFDLAELSRFYHEGTQWEERLFSEFLTERANLTPARALQQYDWVSPSDAMELILTGLCLGYAFESTLAIILEHFE